MHPSGVIQEHIVSPLPHVEKGSLQEVFEAQT